MTEFVFVIKSLIYTVLIIVLLQMEFDGETLEEKTYRVIENSNMAGHIQSVSLGAIQAGKDGWIWISQKIKSSDEIPTSQNEN